jgi:hypothetical protein
MEDSFDDDEEQWEGEEERYCFRTPEHPSGAELVINLLTTWGDKFYIGLTGIEVYTSTGQPANIAQVCGCEPFTPIMYMYSWKFLPKMRKFS